LNSRERQWGANKAKKLLIPVQDILHGSLEGMTGELGLCVDCLKTPIDVINVALM